MLSLHLVIHDKENCSLSSKFIFKVQVVTGFLFFIMEEQATFNKHHALKLKWTSNRYLVTWKNFQKDAYPT
jgi:uncharacterized membrane protein